MSQKKSIQTVRTAKPLKEDLVTPTSVPPPNDDRFGRRRRRTERRLEVFSVHVAETVTEDVWTGIETGDV